MLINDGEVLGAAKAAIEHEAEKAERYAALMGTNRIEEGDNFFKGYQAGLLEGMRIIEEMVATSKSGEPIGEEEGG